MSAAPSSSLKLQLNWKAQKPALNFHPRHFCQKSTLVLNSSVYIFQVRRLPSVLIFHILNHPCSYMSFSLSLVWTTISSSVTGCFIRGQNNSKCHDCTPLKTEFWLQWGARYLVNKPLPAAGISADNVRGWEIVRKMNIWPRSEEDNLSAKDIISRYTSKPERGLFIL